MFGASKYASLEAVEWPQTILICRPIELSYDETRNQTSLRGDSSVIRACREALAPKDSDLQQIDLDNQGCCRRKSKIFRVIGAISYRYLSILSKNRGGGELDFILVENFSKRTNPKTRTK